MDNAMTIKDLADEERPREKLIRYGVDTLSNAEILAIMLRTGSKKATALDLASMLLLQASSLKALNEYSIEELKEIEGIGDAKATQIKAAFELGRRLASFRDEKAIVNSPADVADILIARMGHFKQERFDVVLLDTKNKIISIKNIFKGSLASTIVHPREVFKFAIKKSSASIILAHNHPSGDLTPSNEDIKLTKRMIKVGQIVGIEVLDHLVVGDESYNSLKNKGII